MRNNTIVFPSGRTVELSLYLRVWRQLAAMDAESQANHSVHNFYDDERAATCASFHHWIRSQLDARINAVTVSYGKGRKWKRSWQARTARTARTLNASPNSIVASVVPQELHARLAHRLRAVAA